MIDTRREQIIEIIKKEFIGPDPLPEEDMKQENGEEILTSDNPLIRYSAGILYPQGLNINYENDDEQEEHDSDDNTNIEGSEASITDGYSTKEMLEEAEELINLSNAYKQSAISITAAVYHNDKISIKINAGQYEKSEKIYKRIPIFWNNNSNYLDFPSEKEPFKKIPIKNNNVGTHLIFCITYRYTDKNSLFSVYTFTLENSKEIDYKLQSPKESDCCFQVEFELISFLGFSPMPEYSNFELEDEDYLSNKLLYRKIKNYAIGHGCSADWKEDEVVKTIKSSIIPSYEIKPIFPNKLDNLELKMLDMSDYGNFEYSKKSLKLLCEQYIKWIIETETVAKRLPVEFINIAKGNIEKCRKCYQRMLDGIRILETDENVRKAFLYMNRAMLLQQLHYKMPLQTWETDSDNNIRLEKKYERMPDILDPATWYDMENQEYGVWRPFQIAFILINIESINNPYSNERKQVELIWFPTGGGKTEAYLGLSAFTIFLRRLKNRDDTGTAIIMRYTLRLLTAQQYERASSMICACEIIRKEKEFELGKNRITIGLWVGSATTPNKTEEAIKEFDKMYRGSSTDNPFGVLKCPWCGAQMGIINVKSKTDFIKGYKRSVNGRKKKIIFQCDNENCDFSRNDFILPLDVIDEAIYENPSTLIIGTVDKFAMLPYWPEAQRIFGIDEDKKISPPELIIQDELHLISGPLGSMVGHYETMINTLCIRETERGEIIPKIIASTATISKAKEQCNALYCCGKENVIQFPPPGIDAGESFFAYTDKNAVGRMYVGIFAPGASSHATTNIRLYATLLYAAKALVVNNEEERDPYWTNLGYYNSLRELGQAATWINADITEYLHTIYKRRYEDKKEGYRENRRYIYHIEELTSRIKSDKITSSLQSLVVPYPRKTDNDVFPIDICLATNMISVGVDISRLGLMTVAGQPKTSAEYIQATSRVGRKGNAPGIIFTVYNPGKPRDRSHYEHFKSYHSKIYSFVEPTSVTPFSSPLRKRALHAIIFGLIRLLGNKNTYNNPKIIPPPEEIQKLINIIGKRVSNIDESEYENTLRNINMIFEKWKNNEPQIYHDFMAKEPVPLMYPAGKKPNANWEGRGFETPMSMRNVDLPCEIFVLPNGYSAEEDYNDIP
jgi:hypothetical protein